MVAVFNKELLSWYLITLKVRETVEANRSISNPCSPSTSQPQHQPPTSTSEQQPFSFPRQPAPTLSEPPAAPQSPSITPAQEPAWVISVREKLEQASQEEQSCPWSKLSIYRVPKSLRDGDAKAYVPQLVSIGPYHRGKRRLRDMDQHKWRSFHRVLLRCRHHPSLYFDSIRSLEDRARACYEGRVSISSDEFVECLVLDGCFLLELLRGATITGGFERLGYSRHDPVFAMRGVLHGVRQDMMMLENQIPLFVLDRLLAIQMGIDGTSSSLPGADRRYSVAALAVRFFDPLMPNDEPLRKELQRRMLSESTTSSGPPSSSLSAADVESSTGYAAVVFDPLGGDSDGLHFLDVFRRSLLRKGPLVPTPPKPPPGWMKRRWSRTHRVADRRRQQYVHCVTELRDAGVGFKRRHTDRFWDVDFSSSDGTLRIPRLLIYDGTKSLFLNLIAYEQCHMDHSILSNQMITSYVIFMDNLINSGADVAYLHSRGILEHWLGSDDEVADLFNRLCQEVVFDTDDSYLSSLSESVNSYYNHRWNAWRATLKQKYFGNPWAIISLVAAVVLLVLTTAQTYYSVYAYYRPRS